MAVLPGRAILPAAVTEAGHTLQPWARPSHVGLATVTQLLFQNVIQNKDTVWETVVH